MPLNLDGTKTIRADVTNKFIHKLKCKFNKIKIEEIDERLTTVAAHKTMNYLNINKHKKRGIVDTISAVYILEIASFANIFSQPVHWLPFCFVYGFPYCTKAYKGD